MSYIYDILLNFKSDLIDFYEWDLDDDIIHIKKIPVFRVEKECLFDFKNKILKINSEFLNKIFNRTEIFRGKNKKYVKYSFLVGDSEDVLAISLDNEGKVLEKSDLLPDEYEEIVQIINELDVVNIDYKIISSLKLNFKTRKETEKLNYIISHIYKTGNDKLKYIYYECFNVKEENVNKIKSSILKLIENDEVLINKVYDFYKLLSYNIK